MRDKRDGRFAPMGVMSHVTLQTQHNCMDLEIQYTLLFTYKS